MTLKRFNRKIKTTFHIIKSNKLYYLILIIVFVKGSPSLIETSEYYYTNMLNFTNFVFGLKFTLQTFLMLIAVIIIKYQWINSYSKTAISLFYFLIILTTVMSFFIFCSDSGLFFEHKVVLAFIRSGTYNFALESIVIILFNIYITFCPKGIEGTFSALYFSIKNFSFEIGTIAANLILIAFDIDSENNFHNVEWLLLINIVSLTLGFFWVHKLIIPSKNMLNNKSL